LRILLHEFADTGVFQPGFFIQDAVNADPLRCADRDGLPCAFFLGGLT
jgi:hypothetical protein